MNYKPDMFKNTNRNNDQQRQRRLNDKKIPRKMQKIIITPNEVATLLGYSESYARRILREIKEKLGGKKYVTYQEFAKHYTFTVEEVYQGLHKEFNTEQ